MEVREILSEKERPMLVIFDFKFRLHKKLANDVEKWCCTNKKCKSYVKRLNSEILRNQSKLEINDHNHEAKIEPIRNNRKIRISIKRKATETICRQSSKLIVSALKSSGKSISLSIIFHLFSNIIVCTCLPINSSRKYCQKK